MEKDGVTNFNLDYFIRLVKIAQALDKERDQRLEKEKIIISGILSRFLINNVYFNVMIIYEN